MWIVVLAVLCAALLVAVLWEGLKVRRYTVESEKISAPVRMVLVTDLHGTRYGKGQKKLVEKIRMEKPDLLLLGGDIADDKTSVRGTKEFLEAVSGSYPCFYAAGNHEFRTGELEFIKEMFRSFGVTVLDGCTVRTEAAGQKLLIGGVDDPECFGVKRHEKYETPAGWKAQLESCCRDLRQELFSILISHRPERVEEYRQCGFDLVVAGHAHGGQIRIPGLCDGLFAPSQGFFPKYPGGRHSLGETELIISRGLCRNYLPRVFNPPELVVISLETRKEGRES